MSFFLDEKGEIDCVVKPEVDRQFTPEEVREQKTDRQSDGN